MKIEKLDINGMLLPVGIDDYNPVFHFWVSDEKNGSAIGQIKVKVCAGEQLFWDTGWMDYQESNYIRYQGKELEPKTEYQVLLEVKDQDGNPADNIASAGFETGFLDQQWQAKWVEPKQEEAFEEEHLEFMEMLIPNPKFWGGEARLREVKKLSKTINIKENTAVKRARLYASAHGVYEATVNGKEISDRRLAPEISAYQEMLYYQTYKLESFLKPGANQIDFLLGDGWWIGRLGLAGDSCNYGNKLGLIMQLEVSYQDGSRDIFLSDDSMKCQGSYIRYSDLSIGECHDMNYTVADQETCDQADYSLDNLKGQPLDPVKVTEEIKARKIFRTPKNELVIDFGQVIAGVCRLEIKAKKGQTISFEHAEVLDKDGNYTNNIIGRNKDQKDVIICREGVQTFEPKFTYHGFRYVRVNDAAEENILSATALVIGSPIQKMSEFECSDRRLNQLQHNINWSTRANMFSIPTDCPQREKLGWTGDIQVFASTGCFNYDLRNFLRCWMNNVRIEQGEDGEVPVVVPNLPKQEECQRLMSGGSNSSSGWGDACVFVPYYLYRAYGDKSVLEDNYETMEKWLGYIAANCELKPEGYADFSPEKKARNKYLWTKQYHFGDWLIPSLRALPDGVQIGTEETADVVGSCFYAITAQYFKEICQILGKDDRVKELEELIKNIRNAICQEYIGEDGRIKASPLQGLYVMVIKAGAATGELKQKVVANLIDLIKENDYCLDTGFSSVSYLLDVLYDNGYEDVAYKLLFQTKSPSWLYMVEKGATTMWENWLAILENGTTTDSSFNHYAFGCVGDFIYRKIGGIRPGKAGYSEIVFEPDFSCGLDYSTCSTVTPYGKVSLQWKKTDSGYELSGHVPVGSTAVLQAAGQQTRLESGNFKLSL